MTGRKRDGRCNYDPLAKQELIRECLKPGVSVARMAMQHGVNANLLRTWIAKSRQQSIPGTARALPSAELTSCAPAFVAVQVAAPVAPAAAALPALRLQVRLPNGVAIDFDEVPLEALSPVVQLLGTLPCSS
ncbi:MAG: transposase [Burkholderiaceae bacterium]